MSVPQVFDRNLVALRRNRAAPSFAAHAFLVERAMDDIVDRIGFIKRTFQDVLVIGSWHGLPAERLRQALPGVRIVQCDISPAMLPAGNGVETVVADEEQLPFAPESFDLVVAPLTLHLVNDLPGVLARIRSILRPDGLLLGVLAGGATLSELREAFMAAEIELREGASPRVAPSIDVRDLGSLLQRAQFALPVADADAVSVTYDSAIALMQDVKGMAASNCLVERSRVPMTRELLMRTAEIYDERFGEPDGRIRATFELMTVTGWAPHPDQPKPLRPGSATHSLAEALGTVERSTGTGGGSKD